MTIEEYILQGLKAGDESAYRYVFDHHYITLCYVAQNYVKDAFLAETIVVDVIFHLWETREDLTINTSLRAYLLRAVRNRCINYLNGQKTHHETLFSSLANADSPLLAFDIVDSDAEPLGHLLQQELEGKIYEAIDRLPADCRRVFEKSRFEGKSYAEIAEELGISVNTVKYHMKHALQLLHSDLGKYLFLLMLMQDLATRA